MIRTSFQVTATLLYIYVSPRQSKEQKKNQKVPYRLSRTNAWVFIAFDLGFSMSIVPSGMRILLPRSGGSVVIGIAAQVEVGNSAVATGLSGRGNDARESKSKSDYG